MIIAISAVQIQAVNFMELKRKTEQSCSERPWVWVSLYSRVITHSSLTISRLKRRPAMSAGLIKRSLLYEEYVLMPIFDMGSRIRVEITKELKRMNEPEFLAAASRMKIACKRHIVWEKPPDIEEEFKEEIAC